MMNFSGILIGVLIFFMIGLFHPIVIYAEYYFGSRCWPVFLLVGILCMILSVRMQEILWSVSLGVLGVSCFLFARLQRFLPTQMKKNNDYAF